MNDLEKLLARVDEEIEKSKINPMAMIGMCVIKKIILEMQKEEGDGE